MITDAKEFGAALRQRRKDLGYTQAFLSEFSGFSVTFISDLENGKSTAELGKAIYLANLLGLDCSLTPRSLIMKELLVSVEWSALNETGALSLLERL